MRRVKNIWNISIEDILIALDQLIFSRYIFANHLFVYQMNPALCIQVMKINSNPHNDIFKSALISERRTRMKKEKHTIRQKIKRDFLRFLSQMRFALLVKKVSFN